MVLVQEKKKKKTTVPAAGTKTPYVFNSNDVVLVLQRFSFLLFFFHRSCYIPGAFVSRVYTVIFSYQG